MKIKNLKLSLKMGIGYWVLGMGHGKDRFENKCTNSKNWVCVLRKTEIVLIVAQ
jgi:hypothetical protein